MKYNTNPEFIGIQELKQKHHDQIILFENWASNHQWVQFHQNHYDWWTFPINRPSHYGYQYVVYDGEIEELKKDSMFINLYLKGAEFVCLSWGWDLKFCEYIKSPDAYQSWNQWPIRLYKVAQSVQLFDYSDLFYSLQSFAKELIKQGESFQYNGRDLSKFFR